MKCADRPVAARLPWTIQALNRRYAFCRAYLALKRYLTADFGFIPGRLAVNLLVFANQEERIAFVRAVRAGIPRSKR